MLMMCGCLMRPVNCGKALSVRSAVCMTSVTAATLANQQQYPIPNKPLKTPNYLTSYRTKPPPPHSTRFLWGKGKGDGGCWVGGVGGRSRVGNEMEKTRGWLGARQLVVKEWRWKSGGGKELKKRGGGSEAIRSSRR